MLAVAGSAAATALAVGTTALAASAVDQLISTGSINIGSAFEAAGIAALTGGLTQGLLGNTGISDLGNGITDASSSTTLANVGATAENVVGQSLIAAGATNLIEGGSFGSELLASFGQYAAAVGANGIGNVAQDPDSMLAVGSVGYDLAHAALGCAAGAASGQGCGGGAIGGAASAAFSPDLISAMDPSGAPLTTGQQAALGAFATLLGGGLAGLAGQNVTGGATAAQNEALNNSGQHPGQGGLIDTIVSWAQNTYGDPVGSIENWFGQFGSQVQSGAQATASQSPSNLVAQGVANGANAVLGAGGGLPPAAGSDAVLVNSGQAAPLVNGNSPSNAILSSGSGGGSGSGSDESSVAPSTPTGQGGSPMDVTPGTNSPATIGGISYGGHALDEMQSDGIVPSAVQNAIETGTAVFGKNPGTVAYYDSVNNITVVTSSSSGKVITVSFGKIRQ